MTHYFYDDVAAKLIAYDDEAGTARELQSVRLGVGSQAFSDQQPFPTRNKGKRTKASEARVPKPAVAGKGCPECGSTSRHRKICSRAGGNAKSKMVGNKEWNKLGRDDAMSRMTFGRVKISHSHDIPTETIARNMDLAEDEVNKAIEAETYDDYLKA